MKLTTGYKKPIDSDESVLLAGGGHKNIQQIINDFGAISIIPAVTFNQAINADVLGNSTTADRWKNARTITIGSSSKSLDGSGNVSWSLSDIGVAPSVAGGYLPLSGGTMTGNIQLGTNHYIGNSGFSMLHWDGSGTVLGSTQGGTTIRSNNSNLIHNKNGTNYTIYDSGNFTSGTGANNWVAGNDNRLSNARTANGGAADRLKTYVAKNVGGLTYNYLGGSTKSNDKTGEYVGYSDTTKYNSILRMQSHILANNLYYIDLIFDINSNNIWYRRVTNSETPVLKQIDFVGDSRPASDVSSWAKASSKPTYKYAEILAADELVKGDSDVTDNTEIFTSYASNQGFAEAADSNAYKGKVYRRDAIKVYNYIKNKLDSVYIALNGTQTISGNKTFSSTVEIDSLTARNLTVQGTSSIGTITSGTWNGSKITKDYLPTFALSQTASSTTDAGTNTFSITFDGTSIGSFSVKNGSKGSSGNAGARGSRINTGTAITGNSTTATVYATGITDSLVNDIYINTSTWNVFKCTTAGNASTAKWQYIMNIRGAQGASTASTVTWTDKNGTNTAYKIGFNGANNAIYYDSAGLNYNPSTKTLTGANNIWVQAQANTESRNGIAKTDTNAGSIYFYCQGSTTGTRSIYGQSPSGAEKVILSVDKDNNVSLDGLGINAASRNNGVNKLVRTDGSGYIQAGWINTTSGGFNGAITGINKIYCSEDNYIRYLSPSDFISAMNLVTTNTTVAKSGDKMTGKLIIGNQTTTTAYGTLLDIRTNNNTANSIEWAVSLKNNYNDKTNYNLGTGIKFALGGETETSKWGGIGIVGTSAYSNTQKLIFYSGGSEKASLKSDGNFYVSGTVYSNNIALVNTNDSRLSNSRPANGGTSSYSNSLNVVSSNEIRFSSAGSTQYDDSTDKNVLHINWAWADSAAGYISEYDFRDGHQEFTNIKAAKFITHGSNNTKVVLGDGTTTAISGLSVASATMASRATDGNRYTAISFKPTWANYGAQIYYDTGAVDKFGSRQEMFFRIFQGKENGTSLSTDIYRDYILPYVSGLTSAEYKYIAVMGMTNSGNITITGSYYANSDIRYKTILENKHYTSEDFSKLNVFTYNWKDSKEIQIGTSAQDVEQIIPELISEENEIKSLNYAKLGAIGIIELSKEIIKLKQHIKELEERLNG